MPDTEFEQLVARAAARKRIRTDLLEYRDAVKKMMDADIPLPLILEWLTEKGVDTALTTLRRFVKKTFGETFYDDFSIRNGWQKGARKHTSQPMAVRSIRPPASASPARQRGIEGPVLEDPSDINNFFNRRKI